MAPLVTPFFLMLALLAVPSLAAPPANDVVAKAANANTRFNFDLLKSLSQDPQNAGKNIFYSPYSISAALAMTSLGAAGNTLAEIDKTFYFNDVNTNGNKNAIHEAYKKLIDLYNAGNGNYSLSTANRLFGDKSFEVLQSFQTNAKEYYHAELQQLNFKSGAAEGTINKWVEDQTNNKIKDLIAAGSLRDAVMVLVNAIYFKGTWKTQFDVKNTKPQDFFLSANNKKKVDMMHVTSEFKYYHDDDLKAKVLEMPYKGGDLSMVVVLPDDIEGLGALTQKLTDTTFTGLLAKLVRQKVEVSIPKFKVEAEYQLKETLAKLGIHDLFSDSANLSGINKEDPIKIDAVIHKAFVEVDEKGTEAAAATGLTGVRITSIHIDPPATPIFVGDHPYFFAITDIRSNNILFSGNVKNF